MTSRGSSRNFSEFLMSPGWRDLWEKLAFTTETFASLGLSEDSPDVVVWETCQIRQVVLVTGNRNNDGPDSLEATIRRLNGVDGLPVVTISDPQRISHRSYAERAGVRLLDYLMDLEKYRGAGRLYIP